MRTGLAVLVGAVLMAISALHVYWAAGGRRGSDVVLPQHANGTRTFTPTPLMTLSVAVALLAAALVVLTRGGVVPLPWPPESWVRVGVGALAAVFALRSVGDFRQVGLFRRERGTPFARWDARLFTPLCVGLAAACTALAW